MTMLSYLHANMIIAGAMAKAREDGIRPLAIVVLDASGNIKASGREDGASMFRHDIALGKAWASVAMGSPSRQLGAMAAKVPHFFGALAATGGGKFIPHTGAVLIKDGAGEILGAVGASGGTGDEDEAVVAHGVEKAGLIAG